MCTDFTKFANILYTDVHVSTPHMNLGRTASQNKVIWAKMTCQGKVPIAGEYMYRGKSSYVHPTHNSVYVFIKINQIQCSYTNCAGPIHMSI